MDSLRIAFFKPVAGLSSLADGELLSSIAWSRSASEELTEAARRGDVNAAYLALAKDGFGVADRRGRKAVAGRSPKRSLWSRHAFDESPRSTELLDLWEHFDRPRKASRTQITAGERNGRTKTGKKKHAAIAADSFARLGAWLEQSAASEPKSPLELLLLLECLQQAGGQMPPELGWRVWRAAFEGAVALSNHLNQPVDDGLCDDRRALVFGELPVAAGLIFADVKKSGRLFREGARFLGTQLQEKTDTDGTPNAQLLSRISLWLAPLVRAADWADRGATNLWGEEGQSRFSRLLERSAAVCRGDGCLALANGLTRDVSGMLAEASRLAGWKKRYPPSRYVLSVGGKNGKSAASKRRKRSKDDGHPATQSDWARLACLRTDWSPLSDTLVVAHHGATPLIDLTVIGHSVISGEWGIDVRIDGRPVSWKDDWECSCWFSDDDADFIELHIALDDGVTIERQLLLSRDEHFALLADVVSAAEGSRVEYTSRLPLSPDVSTRADTLTRECRLQRGPVRARAFPLALPDERVMSAAGRFTADEGVLELRQQGEGGLYAPVFLDWNHDRRRRLADWRTLTVTEEGRILKRSLAAAHRIRVGDLQIFAYRSIKSTGEHRAVLGLHTANETVIGPFAEDGEVEPILLVE